MDGRHYGLSREYFIYELTERLLFLYGSIKVPVGVFGREEVVEGGGKNKPEQVFSVLFSVNVMNCSNFVGLARKVCHGVH